MEGSPYSPGAGTLPPVLAGRDGLLHRLMIGLNDVSTVGRTRTQDVILVGPRGVGKTVAVSVYGEQARGSGFEVINLQAVSGRTGLVSSLLERAASGIARHSGPWTRAKQAFDRIASISLGVAGVSLGIATQRETPTGHPDPGTLAEALAALADEVRSDTPGGGLLLTIDEMQEAAGSDLALLAATLHRLTVDHRNAAVLFAGTGLPHTPDVLRLARVTHPDRLFLLEELPVALAPEDALFAVVEPARRLGVRWDPRAATELVAASNGHPAHVQMFAHAAWLAAVGPGLIGLTESRAGLAQAHDDLARRTLGPRWRAMPERQMEYIAALASLGGTSTTSSVARALGRTVQELSQVRDALMREGDLYSLHRGHIALAVPIFGSYALAEYEHARKDATAELIGLDQMRLNAGSTGRSQPLPPA
nr:ATP-binding protein [Nakamurella sp. PAMC28650]